MSARPPARSNIRTSFGFIDSTAGASHSASLAAGSNQSDQNDQQEKSRTADFGVAQSCPFWQIPEATSPTKPLRGDPSEPQLRVQATQTYPVLDGRAAHARKKRMLTCIQSPSVRREAPETEPGALRFPALKTSALCGSGGEVTADVGQ
ncbi:unnamed protein product [Pleuronectes platessa]|uniref:Uncharacterized protein n=1 Tax=Pleuronectes platessa TaxID=8262 RepID=A0A9N7V3Q6_PLEPL|nr:unnamed protein product [Pleuronectes platessa]